MEVLLVSNWNPNGLHEIFPGFFSGHRIKLHDPTHSAPQPLFLMTLHTVRQFLSREQRSRRLLNWYQHPVVNLRLTKTLPVPSIQQSLLNEVCLCLQLRTVAIAF